MLRGSNVGMVQRLGMPVTAAISFARAAVTICKTSQLSPVPSHKQTVRLPPHCGTGESSSSVLPADQQRASIAA